MTPIEELKTSLRKSAALLPNKFSIDAFERLKAVESLEADNARLREALANITRVFQPSQSLREVEAVYIAAEALKEGGSKS